MRYGMSLFMSLVIALFLVACESEPPPSTALPTLAPTAVPLTATPTEPPTPLPTATEAFIPETTADLPENQAFLRVVHAAPGSEAIDVYVEARALAFRLNFRGSTELNGIVAGDYNVVVLPEGDDLDEGTPLASQRISLEGGQTLILLFTGTPDAPALSVLEENTAPLSANESRVTLVHAMPRGPDVTLQQNLVDLTAPIAFGQISDPAVLPSEPLVLIVQSGDQTLTTYNVDLRPRTNYVLVVTGDASNPASIEIIDFSERAPGQSSIRFIHASESNIPVDVYLNGELFINDFGYTRSTDRRLVPTVTYTMTVYQAGANPEENDPLTQTQFNANPDTSLSLILVGRQDDMRITRVEEDLSPTLPEEARMIFVHTLDQAQFLDISAGGDDPLVPSLAYRQASDIFTLDADIYDFFWTERLSDGRQGDTFETAIDVTLDQGFSYLYILTGRLDDQPPVILGTDVGIQALSPQILDENSVQPTPGTPTSIRFMNVINTGEPLNFYVDGFEVSTQQGYAQFSDAILVAEGEHTLSFRTRFSDEDTRDIVVEFEPNTSYIAFAFGDTPFSSDFRVLANDPPLSYQPGDAQIRLLNFNQSGSLTVGLEFRASTGQPLPPIDPTTQAGLPENRQPLLFDTTRLAANIEDNTASAISVIPSGQQDIVIVDSEANLVATILVNFTIQSDYRYEVITFSESVSGQVIAFAAGYPLP